MYWETHFLHLLNRHSTRNYFNTLLLFEAWQPGQYQKLSLTCMIWRISLFSEQTCRFHPGKKLTNTLPQGSALISKFTLRLRMRITPLLQEGMDHLQYRTYLRFIQSMEPKIGNNLLSDEIKYCANICRWIHIQKFENFLVCLSSSIASQLWAWHWHFQM
jgi:hypothetical protein